MEIEGSPLDSNSPPILIEADGEQIGTLPAKFSVIEEGISLIC